PGRLFIARVGYHRHEGRDEPNLIGNLAGVLTERSNYRSMVLGLALRLAFTLCAATTGMLPKTRLEVSKTHVTLVVPPRYQSLLGEMVSKRLTALARTMDRKGDTRIAR